MMLMPGVCKYCVPSGGALASRVPHVPLFIRVRQELQHVSETHSTCLCCELYEVYNSYAAVCMQIDAPHRVVAAYKTNLFEDVAGADPLTLERMTDK